MKTISILLSTLFFTANAGADTYRLPDQLSNLEKAKKCAIDIEQKEKLISLYADDEQDRGDGMVDASIDLNNDGRCELFLRPPRYAIGTGGWGNTIYTLTESGYKKLGYIYPASHNLAEYSNGYAQILVTNNIGHRTNPIFTVSVYTFDGKEYIEAHKAKYTHGAYKDLGLKAFKNKDYKTAETWYWNAYRFGVNGAYHDHDLNILKDANNLALTYIKLNQPYKALELLKKHLPKKMTSSQSWKKT